MKEKIKCFKKLALLMISSFLLLFSQASFAQCVNIFPAPMQTNCGTGTDNCTTGNTNCGCITLKGGVKVINDPFGNGTQLPTPVVQTDNNSTCSATSAPGTTCTAASPLPSQLQPGNFQASTCTGSACNITVAKNSSVTIGTNNQTDFGDVTVEDGATLQFTNNNAGTGTVYRINTLTINGSSSKPSNVTLPAGDYWVKSFANISKDANLSSNTGGSIRILVQNDIQWTGGSGIGPITSTPSGTPAAALLLYSYGNIDISASNTYTGAFYAAKIFDIGGTSTFDGAISGGIVTSAHGGPTFSYNKNLIDIIENSNACNFGADHFGLTYSNTGSRCQLFNLTITALKFDNTTDTTYGAGSNFPKTISIQIVDPNSNNASVASGTWSTLGHGTLSSVVPGSAQYTFAQNGSDNGSVTMRVKPRCLLRGF